MLVGQLSVTWQKNMGNGAKASPCLWVYSSPVCAQCKASETG